MTLDKMDIAVNRLASMILDYMFMTMICMAFFFPVWLAFPGPIPVSFEEPNMDGFCNPLLYLVLSEIPLSFCKDCINGRSLGKRFIKLQVLDNRTGQVASPIKCFIRNIFCIIWPVEVIVTLANPSRRIGDFIAGTRVGPFEPSIVEQPKVDFRKTFVPIAISFVLMLLTMLPIPSLRPSYCKAQFVESSYNKTESKTLEKLFSDSLGHYLTASARVYDKAVNQNVKYISISYSLIGNRRDDESFLRELKRLTNGLLYSKFPKNSFIGRALYILYQSKGGTRVSGNQIGRNFLEVKN